jgi:tetratricopeptide (TPR) repeat protein
MVAYRKAIELKPDRFGSHYNLGGCLKAQGRLDEAVAAYRKAIEIKADFAEAHCNLGHSLKTQGHFGEALEAMRRGHDLGRQQPGWSHPSEGSVKDCERWVELERKLKAPAPLPGVPGRGEVAL